MAASLVLCLLSFSSTSKSSVVFDSVDLIEVNHYYDENGVLVLDQIIFYDWCPKDCRFHVRAWRLLKNRSQLPRGDKKRGYVVTWMDDNVLRKVHAKSLNQTWTQYDPELVERKFRAKERRLGLTKQMRR